MACALLGGAARAETAASERFDVVVIDAGHGGEDEGARGPGGSLEKDLALSVARQLAERLRRHDLRVVMTRDGDVFVPLEGRTHTANDSRADLFVSIHLNASERPDVHGTETFFLSLEASDEASRRLAQRENSALGAATPRPVATDDPVLSILGDLLATEHLADSQVFARMAQEQLGKREPRGSRGVKQAPFVVLAGVQMPASLVEIGFISHRAEERALNRPERQREIVDALVRAVLEFGRRYDARRSAGASARGGR